MAKVTKDLIRGSKDPTTVQGYATKGFNNSGVKGSESVDRMTENGSKGITPDVMKMPSVGVKKIVKDTVKTIAVGNGMDANSGKVKNEKSQSGMSAGNVGSSNMNHK